MVLLITEPLNMTIIKLLFSLLYLLYQVLISNNTLITFQVSFIIPTSCKSTYLVFTWHFFYFSCVSYTLFHNSGCCYHNSGKIAFLISTSLNYHSIYNSRHWDPVATRTGFLSSISEWYSIEMLCLLVPNFHENSICYHSLLSHMFP